MVCSTISSHIFTFFSLLFLIFLSISAASLARFVLSVHFIPDRILWLCFICKIDKHHLEAVFPVDPYMKLFIKKNYRKYVIYHDNTIWLCRTNSSVLFAWNSFQIQSEELECCGYVLPHCSPIKALNANHIRNLHCSSQPERIFTYHHTGALLLLFQNVNIHQKQISNLKFLV